MQPPQTSTDRESEEASTQPRPEGGKRPTAELEAELDRWLIEARKSRGGARALHRALVDRRSFLTSSGWLETLGTGKPNWRGKPVPWLNYGAIRFLEARIRPRMRVFEYGAGSSTFWWAERVAAVDSVEHDPVWAERIGRELRPPATVSWVALDTDGAYCRSILRHDGPYDVVVIDGRDRVNCLRQAMQRLAPDGVVVFDDSHRERYRAGIEEIESAQKFKELQMSGIAPAKQIESFTSILYRPDNVLGI